MALRIVVNNANNKVICEKAEAATALEQLARQLEKQFVENSKRRAAKKAKTKSGDQNLAAGHPL